MKRGLGHEVKKISVFCVCFLVLLDVTITVVVVGAYFVHRTGIQGTVRSMSLLACQSISLLVYQSICLSVYLVPLL